MGLLVMITECLLLFVGTTTHYGDNGSVKRSVDTIV